LKAEVLSMDFAGRGILMHNQVWTKLSWIFNDPASVSQSTKSFPDFEMAPEQLVTDTGPDTFIQVVHFPDLI